MVPQTFDEWKNCLINNCRVHLTKSFVQQRLAVYQNKKNKETQKFISLYGEHHLQNIINWFKQL